MSDRYVLDQAGHPVRCDDLLEWARWMEGGHNRVLAQTEVGPLLVSTVFLGVDHDFGGGPPVLWETMIFNAPDDHPLDGYQDRYTSREAAMEGHARAVVAAREGRPS